MSKFLDTYVNDKYSVLHYKYDVIIFLNIVNIFTAFSEIQRWFSLKVIFSHMKVGWYNWKDFFAYFHFYMYIRRV